MIPQQPLLGDISTTRTQHFKSLFKEENMATIDAILKVTYLFPRFIDQEGNDHMMDEIT
jgi:hypothetical protein